MLEVFNNLFMSIAEQMGVRLAQTAYSVNIKERLDFSCALFDAEGNLIANAPHMPVHLGSMGEIDQDGDRARTPATMKPGDVYVLNDPYNGGTHLPDVTVITPVFRTTGDGPGDGDSPSCSTSARAATTPTSAASPPAPCRPSRRRSRRRACSSTTCSWSRTARMLEAGDAPPARRRRSYPARNPDQNIADLRAQVAANEKGVQELRRMVAHFGLDVVKAYMGHVQDNAEECVRRVIGVLKDGEFAYEMDNGAVIRVKIAIGADRRSAVIDFTGTSAAARQQLQRARRPSCTPPCSTSSARWWTTTSRSTPAA